MPIAFDLDLNLAPDEVPLSPNPPKNASLGNVTLEDQEVPPTENGDLSELEVNTPVPILQQPLSETRLVPYSRRKRGETDELEEILPVEQNPEWLPENWRVKQRTRSDGKSKDKYFIEPERHRQFRSRREVLEYVDSGHRRSNKKLKTGETSNATLSRTAQPKRDRGSPSSPPVTWVYGNRDNSYWVPYIGGETVPDETWKDWQAMFKDDPL